MSVPETTDANWPHEIWMAERDEHDQGVVTAVLSEFATIARFEGDKERDREFHRYVDADIHESAECYYKHMVEQARAEGQALGFRAGIEAAAIHYENGFPAWDVFAHAAREIRAIPAPGDPLAAALALPEVREIRERMDEFCDILLAIEMLTATGDGLSPDETIDIHLLAGRGRSDDPAAWCASDRVVAELRTALGAMKERGQ